MIEILSDGTQVYTLADFLFEHRARVDDAFLHLISQPAEFGPLGEPLGEWEGVEGFFFLGEWEGAGGFFWVSGVVGFGPLREPLGDFSRFG